jgi:hypothetical protein
MSDIYDNKNGEQLRIILKQEKSIFLLLTKVMKKIIVKRMTFDEINHIIILAFTLGYNMVPYDKRSKHDFYYVWDYLNECHAKS